MDQGHCVSRLSSFLVVSSTFQAARRGKGRFRVAFLEFLCLSRLNCLILTSVPFL